MRAVAFVQTSTILPGYVGNMCNAGGFLRLSSVTRLAGGGVTRQRWPGQRAVRARFQGFSKNKETKRLSLLYVGVYFTKVLSGSMIR